MFTQTLRGFERFNKFKREKGIESGSDSEGERSIYKKIEDLINTKDLKKNDCVH